MAKKVLPYVLTDCDGTICDSSLNVGEETLTDILEYQSKSDHRFSIVTGRLGVSSRILAQSLKITLPVISCNGALISDLRTNETLYVKYLDKRLTLKLLDLTIANGIDPIIYSTYQMAGLVGNPRLKLWKDYAAKLKPKDRWPIMDYATLEDLKAAIIEDVVKPVQLLFFAGTPETQENAKQILRDYESQISGFQSLPFMFNVTAMGATKLTGLKAWADILQIDYRDVVVFGDGHNDLPIVAGVKNGYAVGNAVPELKEAAKKVIPTLEENGVGQELIRMIREKTHG